MASMYGWLVEGSRKEATDPMDGPGGGGGGGCGVGGGSTYVWRRMMEMDEFEMYSLVILIVGVTGS